MELEAQVDGSSDEEDVDPATDPELSGQVLAEMLVELKHHGAISATTACLIAYWAHKAGACGPVSALGTKPGQHSSAYSRAFDKYTGLGLQSAHLYNLPCARRVKYDVSRRFEALPFLVPHEAFAEELILDADTLVAATRQAEERNEMPPMWASHPVVEQARQEEKRVLPFVLYIDGVQFTRRDTIIGFSVYFLFSSKRHLIFACRKGELCNCGCRGWCTLYPVFSALAWSFRAMVAGEYPSSRHDGSDWGDGDAGRASLSGTDLGFVGVCLFIKGDWAEMVQRWGFPAWNDESDPCPFCFTSRADMYDLRMVSPMNSTAPPKSYESYLETCRNCQVERVLTPDDIRVVRPCLRSTKRKGGRVLTRNLPHFGLRKGDRLEPTTQQPDIMRFDPEDGDRPCTFWQPSAGSSVRRPNPVFTAGTGVTTDAIGIDWLHTLSMGVFPHLLGYMIQELLRANAWQIGASGEMLIELGIVSLRAALHDWYASEHAKGRDHSKVQELTPGMLGHADNPFLKVDGGEVNGILRFAQAELLPKFGRFLADREDGYRGATDSLVVLLDLCRVHRRRMPPAAIQDFCDATVAHIRHLRSLGIPERPKHHLCIELGVRFVTQFRNARSVRSVPKFCARI